MCGGRGVPGTGAGECSRGPDAALGCWWWSQALGEGPRGPGRPAGILGATGPPLCWKPLAVRPPVVPWRPTRVWVFSTAPGPSQRRAAAPSRDRFCAVIITSLLRRPAHLLSPLSARPPCPSCLPTPRRRPGASRFPGPPRPRSVVRGLCPSNDVGVCWVRGTAVPRRSPPWRAFASAGGSPPALVNWPRVRTDPGGGSGPPSEPPVLAIASTRRPVST